MKWIYKKYTRLSKQCRDSISLTLVIVGVFSSFLSIIGFSLADCSIKNFYTRSIIVVFILIIIFIAVYFVIGYLFGNFIKFHIGQTSVLIKAGNIFSVHEIRLIGCDNHFDTRIDDIHISKKSLHGQFVLYHGQIDEIKNVVENEAKRLKLQKNQDGMYEFPLGTIIKYNSCIDNHTYLLLSMTKLSNEHKACTTLSEYEGMLMKMWGEIDRVYAGYDIALPLLGAGISRFDDGLKDNKTLLRCMICTLKSSGVNLSSSVKILLYGEKRDIPLYEYKDIFHYI